ncbi:MAG: precorrin-3B C(17)-methyltransferase [Lachnospiraceae bacterium]|nr:precorrin-3B C(17)-methyltransferase [Lachnospiraceae bacterium]
MEKKLYVVGMGPGHVDMMTGRAMEVLKSVDTIGGYTTYTDLIRDFFPDKEWISTGMRKEIERCRACFEEANKGKKVALVCSGDAGVYGMASPVEELAPEFPEVEVIVVAGITAACSGAAVLGAPLSHDFCTVSLSDLLTPWEVIEKRLQAAIHGDFCMAIYNPSSHKRHDYLQKACDIMLAAGASPDRKCGIVRNIGREGEEGIVLTLGELRDTQVDMFSTVFVGNSNTKIINGRLVTPRGYSI